MTELFVSIATAPHPQPEQKLTEDFDIMEVTIEHHF